MTAQDPFRYREREAEDEAHEARHKEERKLELGDLRWLMQHPEGRRIATRILDQTAVFGASFNHSGSVMAFNEGKRHIGIWFTAELFEASPNGYLKLLKDYQA